MSNQIILELRERINNKHREALEALSKIAAYLDEIPPSPRSNGHIESTHSDDDEGLSGSGGGGGSIRRRVMTAIRAGYVSVGVIAHETGLNKKQVRGVLNAPDMADTFTREEVNGAIHYKIRGEDDDLLDL